MATSYKELQANIAKMQEQAKAARARELKTAIAQVKDIIKTYDLTASDVGLTAAVKLPAKKKPNIPKAAKYRNPATGATWTGHGKPPNWIKQSQQPRESFLISATNSAPAPTTPETSAAPATPPQAQASAKKVAAPKKTAVKKGATAGKKAAPAKKATAKKAAPAKKATAKKAPPAKKAVAAKKDAPAKKAAVSATAKKTAAEKEAVPS